MSLRARPDRYRLTGTPSLLEVYLRHISTGDAPQAIGHYSQAIRAEGFIFVAGQIAIDPANQQLVEGGVAQQTERALKNIAAILKAAGSNMDSIVRCVVYLKTMDDYIEMNDSYAKFFLKSLPARSTVAVAQLPRDALIEIEATATKPPQVSSRE
jgi:2-iminobutanoate/2-iminopropanoate deaminase